MKGLIFLMGLPIIFALWALLVYGNLGAWTVTLATTLILVGAATAVTGLAGIKIFGSGESEEGVYITWAFSALGALWAGICVGSAGIIGTIPMGGVIYAILSIMWILAIMTYIKKGGSE